MAKTADEIASALMSGLYTYVDASMGDERDDNAHDPFVAWCKPGIPFEPDDFRFSKFMLKGQGASDEERMRDASFQLTQAAGFSRFVDFVPSVGGIVGGRMDGGVLRPGSATLSEVYKRILESSQVAQLPEPAGINEKIQQLREQAKPMRESYEKCQEEFDKAKVEYIKARLNATWSAAADMEFRATGGSLRQKVIKARENWEIEGFKTQYENLLAEIASLRSKRSPAIWRKEALDNYAALPDGQDAAFGEARLTMPYPPSFASGNSGWTSFAVKLEHVDQLNTKKSSKWGASGGFGWGSLKLGGSAAGSTSQTLAISNTNSFSVKMSIAQVPLLRSWYDPWFLRSEFWRFNPASIEGNRNDVVSDKSVPPKGLLVAWPVTALFVRDVEIALDELRDESSELVKTLKAEGKGGWGFGVLNVGGSYERNSEEKRHKADIANGKLTIPGLQLIGFRCELMGQCPKPKEGVTWVDGA
jgi:hypothetical protein